MEGGADADVDAIVDLMESELGASSRKQDASASAKFNIFLKNNVCKTLTLAKLSVEHVTACVNLSDMVHRGLWSMDGFATLREYISPTSASDQNVAKVLGGWTDTKQAGYPPTLACFDKESHHTFTRVREFAQIAPQHILHQAIQRVHATLPPLHQCQEELLDWGSKIRKRFVMERILSLPVQHDKDSRTTEEQAEQFVGMHTFGDILERLLLGHQQLIAANEDLKRWGLFLTRSELL
ncbi:hypothetical protein PHYPSEUDO_014886 [Phytophthora pseudosyringae]|uniref:Uncharacterized protein n=1 Tax=Phytophthora pseudosyringae TaxID=221518 RepID=A0A8T1W4A6_9STRA|nr:hypothetical protein PHYPSEUDO_014886 [Phytophthora pseudosyringae]